MFGDIRNAQGERLDYSFTPGADGRREVVVIAHGVTSHKDRPWLIALSDALGAAGIAALRFSFAGNGESEGRYEEATITKEVDDLGSVIDRLAGWRVAYAGHSMGGAVGTIRTARDPRIRAFVSLAGMVHVAEFMRAHFGDLVPGRDVMLGKAHCPLSQGFLDDAQRIGDVIEDGKAVAVPWLVVHGTADDIVSLQDAWDMRAATQGYLELVEMDGVDHRYTGHEAEMADIVVQWVERALR